MAYIIKRNDQGGGYVAKPGSRASYTRSPDRARTFPTREAAARDRCPENETVLEYFPGSFGRG